MPGIQRIEAADSLKLGESPFWYPATKSVYFVDIEGGSIHRYTPATNTYAKATIANQPTCKVSTFAPIRNSNKFLLSVGRQLGTICWDGNAPTVHFEPLVEVERDDAALRDNRINDGKCDAQGRVWFGTISTPDAHGEFARTAGFYSLATGGKVTQHFGGVRISNGLAWNAANTRFYYVDSPNKCVEVFDFEANNGTISNRRVLFDLPANNIPGLPDGMTIDADDNLWVAVFDGACVLQLSTAGDCGKLLRKVDMPARQCTSVAFAGDAMDELYVTTARFADDLSGPVDGSLFRVTGLGCRGLPFAEAVL